MIIYHIFYIYFIFIIFYFFLRVLWLISLPRFLKSNTRPTDEKRNVKINAKNKYCVDSDYLKWVFLNYCNVEISKFFAHCIRVCIEGWLVLFGQLVHELWQFFSMTKGTPPNWPSTTASWLIFQGWWTIHCVFLLISRSIFLFCFDFYLRKSRKKSKSQNLQPYPL